MASMAGSKPVLLVANGDLRLRANQMCWPAQAAMEPRLDAAVAACAGVIQRAHPTDPAEGHDFIASQKQGVAVFAGLDPEAPLIVVEAVAILAPCAGRTHHPFAARSCQSRTGLPSGSGWSAFSTGVSKTWGATPRAGSPGGRSVRPALWP